MLGEKILEKLYSRRRFGIKPGLEMEAAILEALGNPQNAYGIVHVAGTNGKGSVCAIAESILRTAGLKTGLYTSPHLIRLNERFKVNGSEIEDAELMDLIHCVESAAETASKKIKREATFFETVTAIAFEYFRRKGVQIAVVETGMGGRLDATNLADPLVSVITRISLEHTEHLGPTIRDVAGEKAGIIKKGRPVLCGDMGVDAETVIKEKAEQMGSPFYRAVDHVSITAGSVTMHGQKVTVESQTRGYGTMKIPLLGHHQLENLALAISAVELVEERLGLELSEKVYKDGAGMVEWPGRFQLLSEHPPVVLDGAHNPEAAHVLVRTLERVFKKMPTALVLGMCDDKDAGEFLSAFESVVGKAWIVELDNARSMDPGKLAASAPFSFELEESTLANALEDAVEWAKQNDGVVCITGSLFLVGEVLERMNEKGN